MKKFYSALAIAVAVGASANAKTFDAQNAQVQQMRPMEQLAPSSDASYEDNGMKKICNFKSVEDLYGYYFFGTLVGLEGHDGYEQTTMEIQPSDKDGYVKLIGFFSNISIEGKVDLANQTITFERQFAFHNSYYDEDIYWQPASWISNTEVGYVNSIKLRYLPDGMLLQDQSGNEQVYYKGWIGYEEFEDIISLPYEPNGVRQGWFTINYGNLMQNFEDATAGLEEVNAYTGGGVFKYDASEWVDKDDCSFLDGFLSPIFSNAPAEYPVKVQTRKDNNNIVLLVNPYGAGTPYEESNSSIYPNGYIMLDITNPDLVKVIPFVYSGWADEEGTFEVFFSNMAGQFSLIEGYSDDDVIKALNRYGFEIPTMDESKIVKISDGTYATNYNLIAYGQWTNNDDEVLTGETVITLPGDVGGVEGVTDDVDVNAPKRFYNMQGVEVVNPAAGELVIVKQGSKATKVIVK